jgi:cytochrome c-type biogenesis protein CcmE
MNKKQRIKLLLIAFTSLAFGVGILLSNFSNNIIFFYTPSELKELPFDNQIIRVGGLVKGGSLHKSGLKVEFVITDLENEILVTYRGSLPNLFREGQGMVAKGKLEKEGFVATELLAKHDENYMPKEVADALRKSGRWKQSKP